MAKDKTIKWKYQDPSTINFKSLNVAVIGGTGGIGRAVSQLLATRGANVYVVGQTFRDSDIKNISFVKANLSSMEAAKGVAAQLPVEKFDLVLFTNGIFAARQRQETAEGLEKDMAVSYLSRLIILNDMVPRLKTEKNELGFGSRVFIMGFPGNGQLGTIDDLNQDKSYTVMKAHMNTVAGNEALVIDLAEQYKNLNFYGLNPGLIKTNIRGNLFGEGSMIQSVTETFLGWFTQSADDYAKKIVPLFVAPEIEAHSGAMFDNKGNAMLASKGFSKEYAKKFIAASEDLLKSKGL